MNCVLEISNDSTSSFSAHVHDQLQQPLPLATTAARIGNSQSASSKRMSSSSGSKNNFNLAPGRDPQSHRIIEKRRRDRMNSCLTDLSKLIPCQLFNKRGKGRIEKTEIVEMAIKHLKHLTSSLSAMSKSASSSSSNSELQQVAALSNTSSNSNNNYLNRSEAIQIHSDNESYRLGFKECLSETLRFLVEFEGFSLNQDFVQYPGPNQPAGTYNNAMDYTRGGIVPGPSPGGGFHLSKLVSHLNTHLDRVVESRIKHPLETLNSDHSQDVPSWSHCSNSFSGKDDSLEIKITSHDDMMTDAEGIPMDQSSGSDQGTKRQSSQSENENQGVIVKREPSEGSMSKGSYKKEIKDRFLRMRVESTGTVERSSDNDDMATKQGDQGSSSAGNGGMSTSTFLSSSASSSSSSSSNGSLSSNSSMASFPLFHPNNRGRSFSVNNCPVIAENTNQNRNGTIGNPKDGRSSSLSNVSVFGFALHPSRSYYIPFHSKSIGLLHEALTSAMFDCNSTPMDQQAPNTSSRNMFPVSINVKFDQ